MERIKEKVKQYRWNYKGRILPIGVGCGSIGRGENEEKSIREKEISNGSEHLLKCHEAGFRYYDTSRSYGDSELAVGGFVKQIDRKSIFLATKSAFRAEWEEKDSFEMFKKRFYESFERLNTDYIDLFQIHDRNSFQAATEKVIPFLEDRQKDGMIGYIGQGTRDVTAHEQAIASGKVQSVLTYLEYNLIKCSTKRAIQLAKKHDVLFLNASVFNYGMYKENHEFAKDAVGLAARKNEQAIEMRELCKSMGIDIMAASLQFSLLNPDIDILLAGIRNESNLQATLKQIETPIYPEQWAAIEKLQRTFENFEIQEEYGQHY